MVDQKMINIKEKAKKNTNKISLYNKARLNRLHIRSRSNIIEADKFDDLSRKMHLYNGNAVITTYFGYEENIRRRHTRIHKFYVQGIYVTGKRGYRRKKMHNKITEIKTLSEISN